MDSTTGTISHMSGRSKPTEAFSFECEVTAHQAAGVMLASSVTVAADLLSYSSATLLFHAHGSEAPLTTGTGWSNFELGCAPEVAWLTVSAATGVLSYVDQGSKAGGISAVDDKFYSQDGAVCAVTAWQGHKKHQVSFVAIRPRPWSTLEYDFSAVAVTMGEELHPFAPKPHTQQGLMKPWAYNMACGVSGAGSQTKFSFDRVLSMGLLAGHPVVEISMEGEITVAPAVSLGELFDAIVASGSAGKASLVLFCLWALHETAITRVRKLNTLTISVGFWLAAKSFLAGAMSRDWILWGSTYRRAPGTSQVARLFR
ncbi:unnamed protein product [Symbiodinium natans]|uniref:Uncharacterized protein n=1 Tax=Symbiodinium natans TaxID=878477 RepID=A0A812KB04_9DINO|nr:unnamed protein product [Symbiodinium natans]